MSFFLQQDYRNLRKEVIESIEDVLKNYQSDHQKIDQSVHYLLSISKKNNDDPFNPIENFPVTSGDKPQRANQMFFILSIIKHLDEEDNIKNKYVILAASVFYVIEDIMDSYKLKNTVVSFLYTVFSKCTNTELLDPSNSEFLRHLSYGLDINANTMENLSSEQSQELLSMYSSLIEYLDKNGSKIFSSNKIDNNEIINTSAQRVERLLTKSGLGMFKIPLISDKECSNTKSFTEEIRGLIKVKC